MNKDPYEVLGISKNATLSQVKARYFELARTHHPDKLQNVSNEEKMHHEELFKEITVAYSKIHNDKTRDKNESDPGMDDELPINPDDWRSVWNNLETLFQKPGIWDTMKGIVKETIKDVAVKGFQQLVHRHFVKVPVTLEEVHMEKKKKVRLLLNNVAEPVFIMVDCLEFPSFEVSHQISSGNKDVTITIHVELQLQPHPTYTFDDVLDSWDLFTTVKCNWVDFIHGKEVTLPYIDGSEINVYLEPFVSYKAPIAVKNKGLCELGNLYISVELHPPSKNNWNKLSEDEKTKFTTTLEVLCS